MNKLNFCRYATAKHFARQLAKDYTTANVRKDTLETVKPATKEERKVCNNRESELRGWRGRKIWDQSQGWVGAVF